MSARSSSFSQYGALAVPAGVLAATMLYWLDDRSPGFADTQAFVERRLADLHRMTNLRRQVEAAAERLPNPLRIFRPTR